MTQSPSMTTENQVTAAVRRYSHQTGRHYYACLHDPTVVNPKPCAFFEALPPGHPFAGFCRYNMARQDSQSPDDFGDLCHSSRAVEALRKPSTDEKEKPPSPPRDPLRAI